MKLADRLEKSQVLMMAHWICDRDNNNLFQAEKLKWAGVEMKGDTWTYLGLGLGAVGLVVTVVGLGDKVQTCYDDRRNIFILHFNFCQATGTGTWDLGPGTWDLGPGTWDLGPRT